MAINGERSNKILLVVLYVYSPDLRKKYGSRQFENEVLRKILRSKTGNQGKFKKSYTMRSFMICNLHLTIEWSNKEINIR